MPKANIKHRQINLTRYHWVMPYAVATASYAFFLLALPQILALVVPCLKHLPGSASYAYQECNILLALDRFVLAALIGASLILCAVFLLITPRRLLRLGVTATMLAILTILSYYIYIPRVEAQIYQVPIIFDSITRP